MTRPILIAGGGLAGLSLGIALRRHDVPVTLHEAGRYPRHRVCGEYISGVTDQTLDALGIRDLFEISRQQRTTAWFRKGDLISRRVLPVSAHGISRHFLDDALAERFQEMGGTLIQDSRLPATSEDGTVWCAGRKPARGEWIGLKCHVRDCRMEADLEMHLGDGAYVGLARIEDGLVNVCGLFRLQNDRPSQDVMRTYLERCGLAGLAGRIWAARVDESSFSAVAGFQLGWQPVAGGGLRLGDSLAMIPPFTGNGMSMAFQSAEAAIAPLRQYSAGAVRWPEVVRGITRSLRQNFRRRLFFARLLHPFLTSGRRQAFFASTASRGLLPFQLCYHLLR